MKKKKLKSRKKEVISYTKKEDRLQASMTCEQKQLLFMQLDLQRKIPDPQQRKEYIDKLIEALTVTCDNCDLTKDCKWDNYEQCLAYQNNELLSKKGKPVDPVWFSILARTIMN